MSLAPSTSASSDHNVQVQEFGETVFEDVEERILLEGISMEKSVKVKLKKAMIAVVCDGFNKLNLNNECKISRLQDSILKNNKTLTAISGETWTTLMSSVPTCNTE